MVRWPFALAVALAAAAILAAWWTIDEPAGALSPKITGPVRAAGAGSFAGALASPLELEVPVAAPATAGAPGTSPAGTEDARSKVRSETVVVLEHGTRSGARAGARWELGLGTSVAGAGFDDDAASTIEIPFGLQATLYDDADASGHKLTLGPGVHDLAALGFDDRASAIRVARAGELEDDVGPADAAVLYEHRGDRALARGLQWRLELPSGRSAHVFRASRGDFLNDQASTAWVPPDHELDLFAEHEPYGAALVLGPGLHEIELLGFNDRVSCARLRRVR